MMKKAFFQGWMVLFLPLTACTAQIPSTPPSPAISLPQTTPSMVFSPTDTPSLTLNPTDLFGPIQTSLAPGATFYRCNTLEGFVFPFLSDPSPTPPILALFPQTLHHGPW